MDCISLKNLSSDGTKAVVAVGNRVLLYNAETGDLLESLRGNIDHEFRHGIARKLIFIQDTRIPYIALILVLMEPDLHQVRKFESNYSCS
jgi:hypothetical protein